jgi:hypothetical protein
MFREKKYMRESCIGVVVNITNGSKWSNGTLFLPIVWTGRKLQRQSLRSYIRVLPVCYGS